MAKVYVKIDQNKNIIAIHSDIFIPTEEISEWLLFDEGEGDRYALAQGNYFDSPLSNEHGIYVYQYDDYQKYHNKSSEEYEIEYESVRYKQKSREVREERDRLQVDSDFTQHVSYPCGVDEYKGWIAYKEALRRLPNQKNFPYNVQYPQKPERQYDTKTTLHWQLQEMQDSTTRI